MSPLSPSGARIRGDDYQHVCAWLQALRALQPESGIVAIGIEDPEAGSVDDVTVYRDDQTQEFFQAKSAVDGREAVSVEWLMEPSRAGGPSILQRFFQIWNDGAEGRRTKLTLVTNRPPAAGDPLMALRDGRDGTVAARLKEAPPRSRAGAVRRELANHLRATEEELLAFLANVTFKVSRLHDELKEQAWPLMYAVGLRYDEEALALALGIVRGWVTAGRRRLATDEVRRAIEPLRRAGDLPAASLVIQAIDRDPMPETATVVLDWTDFFPGAEPRTRRQPSEIGLWNGRFRRELQEAARTLRARGQRRVLVRGYMRLPSWFATGVELGATAGFDVVAFQRGAPWSSDGRVGVCAVTDSADRQIGEGVDVSIAIGVAADLEHDVVNYLQKSVPEVGRLVSVIPQAGHSVAIAGPAEARAWALNTRDRVRALVRRYQPEKIHLFLATPHSGALLLGHLWDRMPPTQLYEDLGPVGGYCPSFLIPN
jgi:hypothetical protein